RLEAIRSGLGQRASHAQPNFSSRAITRALESTCPRSTPWRAHVGSAWCRLCQDSPSESTASHHTLPDLSRLENGRSPTAWQMELIDHVTWCSSPMRTRVAQKTAVAAPCQDHVTSPPITGGNRIEVAAHSPNVRLTNTMSLSRSRSGTNLR